MSPVPRILFGVFALLSAVGLAGAALYYGPIVGAVAVPLYVMAAFMGMIALACLSVRARPVMTRIVAAIVFTGGCYFLYGNWQAMEFGHVAGLFAFLIVPAGYVAATGRAPLWWVYAHFRGPQTVSPPAFYDSPTLRLANRKQIRVVDIPPGEAPEFVRQAWVGVTLQLADGEFGPRTVLLFPLRPGQTAPLVLVWHLLTFRLKRIRVYVVDAPQALTALAQRAPEAVAWYRANMAQSVQPGRKLCFHAEGCQEV